MRKRPRPADLVLLCRGLGVRVAWRSVVATSPGTSLEEQPGAAQGCAIVTYCCQDEGKKDTDSVLPVRLPASGRHERGRDLHGE